MTKKTETVVIGAGPGGYVAAIRAAQLGQKVTVIEAEHIGGVCLNVGCIPSKALITAGHRYQEAQHSDFLGLSVKDAQLDFAKTQQWKDQQVVKTLTSGVGMLLKKNGVDVIMGRGQFTGPQSMTITTKNGEEKLEFKQAIVATGSRPIEIPGFKFEGRVLDSTGGLNLKEIPKKLIIIGGGIVGSELGGAYRNLGSEVTIIEGSPTIVPNFEKDISEIVAKRFKQNGVKIFTNAKAKKAVETKNGVAVEVEIKGKTQTIEADYVMVTVGRRPNTENLGLEKAGVTLTDRNLIKVDEQYRTSQKTIFAIGDIVEGLALAHKASYEAKVAAEVISGKNVAKDYRAIPAICFTDPEVATVGYTQAEAKAAGIKAKTANFPMQANGRALSLNATDGFVRLVFEAETELILGAQIVGVNASDLVAELTLAIESYLTLEDISLTIHGHPTLSEMVMDASEIGLGLPIHM
ncbi:MULTISPECIES: dihydrolipoyl dehydrogenase [unclassified Enterococcus]|uniref:dihydrolipoyl dehydrogenase n=1 Tax=unclassified Enterococcus TaxID=2608891 RepID=UPI000A33AEBD|nr:MULTISPECIES: dihydrolipoyl dehydrogenase [unclassified Enterococcus]OTO71404.1 dihydrolipoyl dehydrogenase [Enterococcus sp. 12E11_DIV0728]OUZ15211.1 dihydrolipoyl dehydrogenase [Enterococcus sp. 12F9_DIV0723]